jgi:hypothetical protein
MKPTTYHPRVAVTPPLPLLGHHLDEEKRHSTRRHELACAAALLCPPLSVAALLTVASHLRAVQPGQRECHDTVHLLHRVLAESPPIEAEQLRFSRRRLPSRGAHHRPSSFEHLQPRHHFKKDRLSP